MQMVFRLNAAVQHQGGQVVSSEDAGTQRQGGQVVSADLLEAQRQGWQVVSADKIDAQGPGSQQLATGQPAASTAVSAPVPGMRSGVRVVHLAGTRQCKWRPRFWMRVISLATFCPQLKSPKAGMFCVTCSSTSSMKTVSLPLVLRLEPADLGRRRHGSPDAPP